MGDPASTPRRKHSLAKKIGAYGALYLAVLFAGVPFERQMNRLHQWWWDGLGSFPSGTTAHRVIDLLGHGFMIFLPAALVGVFFASIVAGSFALLVRSVNQLGVREGKRDFIEPLRRWVTAHPTWVKAITLGILSAWGINTELDGLGMWGGREQIGGEWVAFIAAFGIIGVPVTLALTELLRAAVRAFVAPVVEEIEPQVAEVATHEISFDAVAVTTETYAAVSAMMALNGVALTLAVSSHRLFADPKVLGGLLAYMAVALGGAALFRHASRVAIGVDGVLVKGTSRTRFFAYRELDGVRAEGADLVLLRRGKVVLRLQLHGDDASKRDAVLARIREAIVCVKEGRSAVSAQIVSSATPEELARSAAGAADYRGAALTRDQLWALVEGPEIEASARRAAAEALAKTSDGGDHARLRVAAEHCAAPEVRVAIEQLADEATEHDRHVHGALGRRSA